MKREQTELDIAWMAGLLEGEGCFQLRASRAIHQSVTPTIDLQMRDKDIVERAAELMNGTVRGYAPRKKTHSQMFRTTVQGPRAANWMGLIRSYLGKRRGAKVDWILKEWSRPNQWARAPKGVHRKPSCHPDREYISHGLCSTCYCRYWRMQGPLRGQKLAIWTRKVHRKSDLK